MDAAAAMNGPAFVQGLPKRVEDRLKEVACETVVASAAAHIGAERYVRVLEVLSDVGVGADQSAI